MGTRSLLDEAHAYVEEVWDDVERDIDLLLRIESVEDLAHAGDGMPFGPGPRRALDCALQIAERLGLKTHNCEGYVGIADLPGDGNQYLATIAHADIVPIGTGWHFDPLRLSHKDGYLVGRGVLDDKGPLVLSLYAAHFLVRKMRSEGMRLPHTLRCIVGTNEETGMVDVDYFTEHFPQPLFCFTPDAEFPAICGEKGRLCVELASPVISASDGGILSLEGGEASNAVVGHASAVVAAELPRTLAREGIVAEALDSEGGPFAHVRVSATGMGGHAAMPEETRSAVGLLCETLGEVVACSEGQRAFLDLERLVFADVWGKALGIDATDDVFDPLTCAGTTIRTVEVDGGRRFVQTLDIRFPSSVRVDTLMARLSRVSRKHGCEASMVSSSDPFLTSPDSEQVQTLLGAYRDVCGREGKAFTIGGGTYARHFQSAVAFGPIDPSDNDNPSWVGPEHGPDEGVRRDRMQRALEVYVVAIARLMGLEA